MRAWCKIVESFYFCPVINISREKMVFTEGLIILTWKAALQVKMDYTVDNTVKGRACASAA